jgi:MFS superfamily sulfate permease-like transporter
MHASWHKDAIAGFSVALVALPLSIGIALASGAPASAGLIAAIVGGVIGSWLGGASLTINGPAAGLIVIVLEAIQSLGQGNNELGFRYMLAATVVAGAMQVVFGALKLARKGLMCPSSVIHGMMAAIGLIILAKQLHVMLGYAPVAKNPVMLFAELPLAIRNMQPLIFAVGALSLATLYLWPKVPLEFAKKVPAPLVSVVLGVVLAVIFGFSGKMLLQVPADVTSWLIFPDFSIMQTWDGWRVALTLAMVASLETTLSAAAVDKLDPKHRRSNLDRDLLSKGVCNMLSAMLGGLPMIAEIVRSSANVSYGATSWRANFSHGLCLLAAVLLLPAALGLLPLASLAAILVMVGSRLGSPAHFAHAKKVGWDHLTGFLVTMVLTLAVDLLVGIFAGIVAQYAVEVFMGLRLKHTFVARYRETENHGVHHFTVKSALMFSNFETLKLKLLHVIHQQQTVFLELESCTYVDSNVMEQLLDLQSLARERGVEFKIHYSGAHATLGTETNSAIRKIA